MVIIPLRVVNVRGEKYNCLFKCHLPRTKREFSIVISIVSALISFVWERFDCWLAAGRFCAARRSCSVRPFTGRAKISRDKTTITRIAAFSKNQKRPFCSQRCLHAPVHCATRVRTTNPRRFVMKAKSIHYPVNIHHPPHDLLYLKYTPEKRTSKSNPTFSLSIFVYTTARRQLSLILHIYCAVLVNNYL